jgi:pyruvate dehydrogenase E2 component (dihydrolipoamide acetyltransferase)
MATVMEMPKLSDTMKEGAIAKWLKKEGEKVQSGLPVVEIETDKATMEYEATAGGILLKILVADGGTCALNAPIAVIGKADENWKEALEKYEAKKGSSKSSAAPAHTPAAVSSVPAVTLNLGEASAPSSDRVKASPLAKKMAAQNGISLNSVQGTGPGGRIIAKDVENVPTRGSDYTSSPVATSLASGSTKLPVSMMRKTIASRLSESWQSNPTFFLTLSINMGPLLNWRKAAVAKMAEDQKFSVSDVIGFMVARALKKHPVINSSWRGDHILQHHDVHLGFAVALPNGLVTPVLPFADRSNLLDLTKRSKELVKLAKDGKLQPEQYSGGTFTISNLGMQGIEEFTAIINPPQAAILAVGATIATPTVGATGEILVEQKMKVTLSCDHRVIDGFEGSQFLKTLKSYLEDPYNALFFG